MRQATDCNRPSRRAPHRLSAAVGCGFAAIPLILALAAPALAHPIPDVPVRAFFEPDGSGVVRIELDTRCLTKDPATAPYLLKSDLARLSTGELRQLVARARRYLPRTLELVFAPGGVARPDWQFEFTTFLNAPLRRDEDPVMLTGTWRFDVAGRQGYRVRALPAGKLSVLFLNYYQGKVLKGVEVLFAGEESKPLDLSALAEAELGDVHEQLLGSIAPGP